MPAYSEEVDAGIEEGAALECLLSPVGIQTNARSIVGLTWVRNQLV
jgi:hypothetical protein